MIDMHVEVPRLKKDTRHISYHQEGQAKRGAGERTGPEKGQGQTTNHRPQTLSLDRSA